MSFYLVQRLAHAHEGNGKTGFDSKFELEYMGSAEYEFRTPNESLKRMRAKPIIVFHHEAYSVAGTYLDQPVSVFFVAHKDGLLDKITAHTEWLNAPRERCKEQSYFRENLTGLDWRGDPIDSYYTRTVAWWSFNDDIAWALDPEAAGKLASAFLPRT